MKSQYNRFKQFFFLGAVLLSMVACKKNYINPNQPTGDQVFSSVNGITGVATNLQALYTGDGGLLYDAITSSGLLTGELAVVNAGNTNEQQLYEGGGNVEATNGLITSFWTTANKIVYDADNVINSVKIVGDKGYASGLIAYSSIFKALAIGNMAEFWDHVPDSVGAKVGFVSSADGYKMAVTVLNNALSAVSANPVSSTFTANVPAGIDITNTLYALKARYSLFAGDNAGALSAAASVNPAIQSVFNFSSVNLNPVFSSATSTNNLYQPKDLSMGLPSALEPDIADKRLPFYITSLPSSGTTLGIKGFFAATTQPIPVYLPGEMTLIKAEALARQGTLQDALDTLNHVVTKQPAADPYGVGAALPPIAGPLSKDDLLAQIYRHRAIELYMAGLTLDDQRRFGRPDSERKRTYLPYPFVERNDNPNTPPDPTF